MVHLDNRNRLSREKNSPKRKGNIHPHKDLSKNVHSITHNSQKLETTGMSINWWMDINTSLPQIAAQSQKDRKWMWHKWTAKTLCSVKEVWCKRPHIVWFHLYAMSRIREFPGNELFPRGGSVNGEWLQMSPRFLLGWWRSAKTGPQWWLCHRWIYYRVLSYMLKVNECYTM